ncbi:uncharacterized protein ACA1_364220 [Acanthamoeba castellanii str. Neff]|uniref:Uncharacterized protein n=1 Tax=Acanthamoeba castellanii (strain ATCC 30010 / Neff) TaxID=1257118 RepID=L8GP26_ACACF|nr:uncharacterized protein ACA1_364220 [Acanthamoeba castellanii str. Neff]ELR13896.1 hypothetical protein ACA1_364220 [Acanthamoeba castellanii str. Neff]
MAGSASCWTAVRIVRPTGPPRPLLTELIDDALWSLVGQPHAPHLRHAFVSATDAVVFVVGPPNPLMAHNLRVKWGDAPPASLRVVSGAVRGAAGRIATTPTPESGDGDSGGWGSVALDMEVVGSPPDPGYKGIWAPIEVHTDIVYDQQLGLNQRIEHHAPGRVPPARFWAAAARGGYGAAASAELLCVQSQAAIAYQFAVRAVLLDSGWGAALAQRGVHVKLMGFETNNPLHDDHSGRGAHFHVAIRGTPTEPKLLHLGRDLTPHLYLTSAGRLDPALTVHRGWSLGVFGMFVRDDGALEFGPLVGVRHGSSSDMHLHVRQSKQADRDPVVAWNKRTDEGSAWVQFFNGGVTVWCSARSWRFLHVRAAKTGAGDQVVQWKNATDPGSWWTVGADGGLKSVRSGHHLTLPPGSGPRSPAVQSPQCDRWVVEQLRGGPAYRVDVSYAVEMVQATPDGATVRIHRNGAPWAEVATTDDAYGGRLTVVETAGQGQRREQVIHYDPLTGTPLP